MKNDVVSKDTDIVNKGTDVLSKEDIWKAQDTKTREVDVPEWGGKVYIRSLSGKERDHFETSMIQIRGKSQKENFENLRARLLVLTIVDAEGKKIFTSKDIEPLGEKNAAVLDRLFIIAQQLSGLRKEDVDELTKNSEAIQDEDSISD